MQIQTEVLRYVNDPYKVLAPSSFYNTSSYLFSTYVVCTPPLLFDFAFFP